MRKGIQIVTINEAKAILLLYRPGSADEQDPQVAEALALANRDVELGRWLAEHCARQEALRGKFREIVVPAGLMEQIISEQAARGRSHYWRPRLVLAGLVVILGVLLAPYWLLPYLRARPNDIFLANYEGQMANTALRGYGMDLLTNNSAAIRAHLAEKRAPSDFVVPAGLAQAAMVGCAVAGWRDTQASMICFQTGRPLPKGQASDLWLFVVDRSAIPDAPKAGPAKIVTVDKLTAAVWEQGSKVYLLGLEGDEATLRKFL